MIQKQPYRIWPIVLLLFPFHATAGNYATCILDRMPGTQNDSVASAVIRICNEKYPGRLDSVIGGEGRYVSRN